VLREVALLGLVAVVLAVLVQAFLARVYLIPSQSMERTLHGCTGCTGDRVLVDKLTFDFGTPKPGDVVVFRRPDGWERPDTASPPSTNPVARTVRRVGSWLGLATPDEDDYIKRVIAVGGQTVRCCDDHNRVLVDGHPLVEPYLYWEPGRGTTQDPFPVTAVPAGYLFVLGDNRNDSCDSRCQGHGGAAGLVPVDHVIGKARYIVLPPSRWRGVGDQDPQVTALGAPVWETGVPAGVGALAAWPTLLVGRRLVARLLRGRGLRRLGSARRGRRR
jgi:signal peptidase I